MPKFSAYMKGGDGSVGPPGSAFISGIVSNTNNLPTNPPVNRQIFLVGDSNPKYIYAYINGEWVNQGLTASKIEEITASITTIPWTTTSQPSVQTQFSTSNQLDSLNFDFVIPEAQPAGFGNISVTSNKLSFSNNPIVTITTDGEDWEKNFYFNFGIPAGEPAGFSTNHTVNVSTLDWDTSATVKITTNNSPDTSKSFNFDFGIPKGREAGFSTFSANIQSIGWTEDPTVSISENGPSWGKNIDFNFKVPKTRPAGFGTSNTASATTIAFGATPIVSISNSGEDYAKNFHFDFKIPAGEPAGFGTLHVQSIKVPSGTDPTVEITAVTSSPERAKEFNFKFGIPEGVAAGFSTQQNVSVSTLDTGEQATVQISTVTTSPETSKVFNFHFGLPRGDALSIYDGITFTSTQDGYNYYWKNTNGTSTLVFSRGSVEKLPIYIYNNNNESIASTFKISTTTIEYEADEKFDGTMYLMMPATLQNIEIGNVSSTTYGYDPIISKSTGSTSTNLILDFTIPDGYPGRSVIDSMTTNINSLSTNKVDKTGDTMSGLLTINKSETNLRFKNPILDINENPLSSTYYGLEYSDKNGERIAVIEASKLTTGDTGIRIASKNNNIENSLYLGVKSNDEPTMWVSNPTLWRDALGIDLTNDGVNPSAVSVADNTWTSIANNTFSSGRYILCFTVQFNSNATGHRRAVLSTTANSESNIGIISTCSSQAVNGTVTLLNGFFPLYVTSNNYTIYLNVLQNSGGNLNATGRLYWIRLRDN